MALSDWFAKHFGMEAGNIPNSFTIAMGEKIRMARLESGFSQAQLGERAYLNQASISQIENGKREVSTTEIISFSHALSKPIFYFFPDKIQRHFESSSLEINELLLVAQRLNEDDLKRLIIQARALTRE